MKIIFINNFCSKPIKHFIKFFQGLSRISNNFTFYQLHCFTTNSFISSNNHKSVTIYYFSSFWKKTSSNYNITQINNKKTAENALTETFIDFYIKHSVSPSNASAN